MKVENKLTIEYHDKVKVKNVPWKFQSSEGKLRSLINTKVASVDGLLPATFV